MIHVFRRSPYDDHELRKSLERRTPPTVYPIAVGTNVRYPLQLADGFPTHPDRKAPDVAEVHTGQPHRGHLSLDLRLSERGFVAGAGTSSLLPEPAETVLDLVAAIQFMTDSPHSRVAAFRPPEAPR
jgi:hypothetical protein